ncbi:MAG: amidohydrolase [Candidatus Promineifilaceae bacterium]|jgi:amidohydrolase
MGRKGVLQQNLLEIRHELHRRAELSGAEIRTAELLAASLAACRPDTLMTALGGHGLAATFGDKNSGPTVLLRCDTDALPLPERAGLTYASEADGVSHKCGHDGHMTMMLGVAQELAQARPERGRVVLLFQPAEETGAGASAVLKDPAYAELQPDISLGLHNLPGFPLGQVVLRDGVFAAASRGLTISLAGVSSHAAEPEAGRSPAPAAAALVQALSALPQFETGLSESAKVTVVGIVVGGPAFGTSPGTGEVMATLRAYSDEAMERLSRRCVDLAAGIASAHGLEHSLTWSEDFPATVNDPQVVAAVETAALNGGLEVERSANPFAWSEDFGHFTAAGPGALIGLGSGLKQPPLHHPDYDFPDALLPIGVAFWRAVLQNLLP